MKQKLLAFVKANIKEWEIAEGWDFIERHYPIPNELEDKIYDLCEEFSDDNDMPEGWWLTEFMDAEDVFTNL